MVTHTSEELTEEVQVSDGDEVIVHLDDGSTVDLKAMAQAGLGHNITRLRIAHQDTGEIPAVTAVVDPHYPSTTLGADNLG